MGFSRFRNLMKHKADGDGDNSLRQLTQRHYSVNNPVLRIQKRELEFEYSQMSISYTSLAEMHPPFELFVVVGADPTRLHGNAVSVPRILYKYPEKKKIEYENIHYFCIPGGVKTRIMAKTQSSDDLFQLLFSQSSIPSHSVSSSGYAFTLSDAMGKVSLYGVCVTRTELVNDLPSFAHSSSKLAFQRSSTVGTRCYCVLTRFPHISFYFQFLDRILLLQHLEQVSSSTLQSLALALPFGPDTTQMSDESLGGEKLSKENRRIRRSTMKTIEICVGDGEFGSTRAEESTSSEITSTPPKPRTPISTMVDFREDFGIEEEKKGIQVAQIPEDETENRISSYISLFYETISPVPGVEIDFQPFDVIPELKFKFPPSQDTSMVYFAVPLLFRHMDSYLITCFINSILLERPTVVVSANMQALSGSVMAVPALLYHLQWSGISIPLLPVNIQEMLEAPVPYIVGTPHIATRTNLPENVVIIDIDRHEYRAVRPLPKLPKYKYLEERMLRFSKEHFNMPYFRHHPLNETESGRVDVKHFLKSLSGFHDELYGHVSQYTVTNITDIENPEMIFLKENFVQSYAESNRAFISEFVNTQMFTVFCERLMQSKMVAETSTSSITCFE